MARADGKSGCGCITIFVILMGIGTVLQWCENKEKRPAPAVQNQYQRELDKLNEDAARFESEQKKEIELKGKRNSLLLPVVTVDNRFIFYTMVVKDKRTGLTWIRDANLGWQSWNNSNKLVKELNKKQYGGFKDWRMPSNKELLTLITYAKSKNHADPSGFNGPSKLFNEMGFYDVKSGHIDIRSGYYYWTSTASSMHVNYVKVVSMYNGYVYDVSKDERHYVWPVRSGL